MGACCTAKQKQGEQSDKDKSQKNDNKEESQKNQAQPKDKPIDVVDQEEIEPEINPDIKPFQIENEDVVDLESDREKQHQKSDVNMTYQGGSKK